MRYYDTTDATSLSKDYAERARSAKKTWVFQNDKNGWVYLDDTYFMKDISSNDLYYRSDDFGKKIVTLPVGTYIIEETKPPTGYLLPNCNDRTYIEVVTPVANSKSESIETYHHETYVPIEDKAFSQSDGTDITYLGLKWNEW